MSARPTIEHPLMGANLRTLLATVRTAGPIPARHWPLLAAMFGSALARAPLSALESAIATLRTRRHDMPPPVFVIGHWRSGTTHLHNLLGKDPRFGHISPLMSGLPDNVLTLVRWLRPLLEKALPEDRHVDRVAVTPDSPQEDEIPLASLQPLSVFHAVYFPLRFERRFDAGVFFDGVDERAIARWERRHVQWLRKVSIAVGGRRLLIKNPVYTGRIARLRALWPGARFVHIVRDPFAVFRSTLLYYRKLLPGLALQPFEHLDLERFVLRCYARLMARYEAQAAALGPHELVELRYEELVGDPLGQLARVYEQLQLGDFETARPAIERYLDSIRDYRRNTLPPLEPEQIERIRTWWAPQIERWGYAAPEPAPPELDSAPHPDVVATQRP
ncbi:MAG: sulfotransferase [Planctomycetota bacterium]|nr:MAG: sulfotransferase [Planctomycetota bacterium]